ncbi:MAG: Bax inhibitor-1/YccA family protein, partial [Bacilli bacterium]
MVSATYASIYEGIVLQAVLATLGVFLACLTLYATGLVKVTPMFQKVVLGATLGIFFMYLLNFVLSFFGTNIPFLHQATPLGIGISVVIIIVAALNLFLDFNNIERGARQGLAKHYEWASALGLFVTIVWLYLEILRLISMITSRD